MNEMNLRIDEDYKNLLPELTAEEYTGLERDIVKHGILSPIIVWNGVIVDGHNRYAIAQAHIFPDAAIPTKEIAFDGKAQAIEWIINNQKSRRNLTKSQLVAAWSKYEEEVSKEAEARMKEGRNQYSPSKNFSEGKEPIRTAAEVAAKIGVSEPTYRDMKLITEKGTEDQIARMDKGGKGNGVSTIAKEIKGKQSDVTKKTSESKPLEPAEDFLKRSRAEAMAAETRTAIGVISVQAQKITKDRLNGLSEIYKKKELEEAINQVRSMIDNCQRAMDLCKSFLEVCCQ